MAALLMNYVFTGKTSKGKLKTFQRPKNLLCSFIPGGEGYVFPEVQRESSQPASFQTPIRLTTAMVSKTITSSFGQESLDICLMRQPIPTLCQAPCQGAGCVAMRKAWTLSAFIIHCYHTQLPQTWQLKTEIYSFIVLEARSMKSGYWQGHAPSQDSRAEFSLLSPSF